MTPTSPFSISNFSLCELEEITFHLHTYQSRRFLFSFSFLYIHCLVYIMYLYKKIPLIVNDNLLFTFYLKKTTVTLYILLFFPRLFWRYHVVSVISRGWTRISELRSPRIADDCGRLGFSGWYVMPGRN